MSTVTAKTVILVTRNLPPAVGGMERLIQHMVDELAVGFRVHLVGPAGCRPFVPADVGLDELPPSPLPLFLVRALAVAVWRGRSLRPAVVFAGSGLTAPLAWLAARGCGACSMVYLHGLDIDTDHLLYRLFWRPFIRHCDRVLVNSSFTRQRALAVGVADQRMATLHPGTGLPPAADADRAAQMFRDRYRLGEAPVMLYVGRITKRKGLLPFVRDVLPMVLERVPQARLVVVGDEPAKALLRDQGERARVEQALADNGCASSVLWVGEVSDDRWLSAAYYSAKLSVFPVQCRANDNEGFGMVAIEAAAHGVFTVAYRAGGVPDAVADGRSGKLVPAGDSAAFAAAVVAAIAAPTSDTARAERRAFAAQFAWPLFGQRLRDLVAGGPGR